MAQAAVSPPGNTWSIPVGLNPFNTIFGAFSRDLGIDLGTANTLVHVRGKGIVISEPSVVAIDTRTKKVHAVGAEAKAMVGKTPANIVAVRPLKDGVIADFDVVEQMLAYFIKKAHTYAALPLIDPRPRVVVGVPSGVTEVEKRAAREAALNAKAREAYVVEEPMAAAIGAGLPVEEPIGSMIVDIGGGTTEIAVIALGGIVINHSIRIAGDEIDEAIIQFARREYNLLIGERMAEKAKIAAGSAYPLDEEIKVVLRGRDLLTGLPKAIEVSSVELREGIAGPVNAIVAEVRAALEETPPELVADIMEHGIMLAGGGSLLHGLDKRIAAETKMPVHIAQDPLSCVARGAGKMVEHFDNSVYQDILMRTQTTRRVRR
nr:rod shape-determining protein [Chloroflexus aurantiacus]